MLYKIGCNPTNTLCGALPIQYGPFRVIRGALVFHWYTNAPPRCRTSQYRRTLIFPSELLWTDHADPVFDGVELAGFKSRTNAF